MRCWTGVALFWAVAGSLAAQTLTVGTGVAGAGQTYPTVLNVTLASVGAQIAGLQFDLAYDMNALTVTIGTGSSATAASKAVSVNNLGTTQRAILSGLNQIVMADGVVATLSITVTAGSSLGSRTLTLSNLAATDPSANPIALTGVNGAVNVAQTYLVGDVYPHPSDTAPNFGSGSVSLQSLVYMLFAINNLAPMPAACSDRFDAADTYPKDTAAQRGGDGAVGIQDLIVELFRQTGLDKSQAVRPSLGGCAKPQSAIAQSRAIQAAALVGLPIDGGLVLEAAESSGAAEQVPVYLEAWRDMVNVAVTFGLGDQVSPLRFEAAGTAPTLVEAGQVGVIAAAWLDGVSVPAGGRLLLGYVTGPAGMSANLKVYGMSASGLDDGRDVRLGTSTRRARQQQ